MILSPIHHTFGPHVTGRYALRALGLLCVPWKWKRGKSIEELRSTMRKNSDVFLFASGRDALLALLRSLDLEEGSEIIVQGYTCVAVPNAVHAAGGVPVYADIDRETLNLDPTSVERAITTRTRAIICQHTFGIPADTDHLRAICDRHNLLLIEDCAHIIPDASGPAEIGRKGDAMFMSFGRDKAISGITGGAVTVKDAGIAARLRQEEEQARPLPLLTIKRLLFYPLAYTVARPFYGLFCGKLFLYILKKIHALVPVLTRKEKEGSVPPVLRRMPNACAWLTHEERKTLKAKNDHRRALTRLYLDEAKKRGWYAPSGIREDLPMQKFPLFTKNANGIRAALKKKNIHLDDGWTGCVVCPADVNMAATDYEPGSDPEAEAAAEMILSLPTHPTMSHEHALQLVDEIDRLIQ